MPLLQRAAEVVLHGMNIAQAQSWTWTCPGAPQLVLENLGGGMQGTEVQIGFCKLPSDRTPCAGANLDVDVPWKYLNFFLEDDMRLREIGREYGAGRMLTGEVKKELIGVRSGG